MIKSEKVVREGLLEEGTLVHGPAEGRPEREALQVEARAGAEVLWQGCPGVWWGEAESSTSPAG